jgi:glycosyltransferase involved in cell wall biosynthesis
MKKPFISICIPAYKREEYCKRLLDSIVTQTFTDYEVIISDDTPDDSVEKLVARYNNVLPVIYSRNIPSAGTPANFNIAMLKANGEWIKIMHGDDWFATDNALQKFAAAARTANCSFIFSACNNIYSGSGKEVNEYLTGWKKEMLEDNVLNLFFLNVIGHPPTTMHRKDDEILYDLRFRWVADIDFYIRYFTKHPGYIYLPEMLINIGTDETQVSSGLYKNPRIEIPEYLSMLEKFPPGLLLQHEYVFHCVWNLVKKFRIKNIAMIRDYGYSGALPDKIQEIIDFQKPIPRIIIKQTNWSRILMKRCFKKLTQGLNK